VQVHEPATPRLSLIDAAHTRTQISRLPELTLTYSDLISNGSQ